jgi:hypothetical protein
VKTTPKPRATKKSSGELVGLLPPLDWEVVAAGLSELVDEAIAEVGDGVDVEVID